MNVKDRVVSAKHTLTGSGLGKAVAKATSHEVIGPKRKHVDYILTALETDNVSIPDTADMLFERCNNSSWVVVFKSLVTFHHIMSNGNERFVQYIASRSATWMLQSFLDKNGVQGYDMSHIIRKYASYLMEKAYSYRTMGFDFCKIARGKDSGVLRNMDTVKLLKALPSIQVQLDSLVATEISSNDLTNGVITAAFMLLFRDLIRLFACYNDGIINLLEKYFEMKKADCKASLDIYKKFLSRMDKVSEFLRAAEDAGIDKGDIPDLSKAPNSLLEALETHYQSLEKGKSVVLPTRPVTIPAFNIEQWYMKNEKWMESSIDSMPSATPTMAPVTTEENTKEEFFEQQKRLLEMFQKGKVEEQPKQIPAQVSPQLPIQIDNAPASQALFTSLPVNNTLNFSAETSNIDNSSNKPSDDLLCLSADVVTPSPFLQTSPYGGIPAFGPTNTNLFGYPGYDATVNKPVDFSSTNPFLQPTHSSSTPNLLDDILTPETPGGNPIVTTPTDNSTTNDGHRTTDVNKGLERVALSLDNLNINPATLKANTQRGHQWNPSNQSQKTGGANYQMSPVPRSTMPSIGYNPMAQPRFPQFGAPVQPYYGLPQPQLMQESMMRKK